MSDDAQGRKERRTSCRMIRRAGRREQQSGSACALTARTVPSSRGLRLMNMERGDS
jgi:hypothetical protein